MPRKRLVADYLRYGGRADQQPRRKRTRGNPDCAIHVTLPDFHRLQRLPRAEVRFFCLTGG